MTSIVSVKNLHKKYELGKNNFVNALRGANAEITKGEMVAIMGPSGSGKSTMMHIIGCLDRADEGEVILDGQQVDKLKRKQLNQLRSQKIGFIFQEFNLIPTLTALENVALAAEYAGVSRRQAREKAIKMLKLMGLSSRIKHLPSELSGGQQQRVAIARSLVNDPDIILGDEPTGDLDTATSKEIVDILKKINKDIGTTFILVTHNPEVAKECHRTIRMLDGKIVS